MCSRFRSISCPLRKGLAARDPGSFKTGFLIDEGKRSSDFVASSSFQRFHGFIRQSSPVLSLSEKLPEAL
jgi:hypothetical protein